jgi:glycosyltransferase involved in cell wall biosynthesis
MVRPPGDSPPVSAVIITLDAERLLEDVLGAVAWCDEIVVVDSGSTDATLEIARRHGCRVSHRDFDGFGPQKAHAVALARNDWVLAIDADEVVTPELAAEMQAAVRDSASGRTSHAGFSVPRTLVFLGRVMRHSRERYLCLFDRRRGGFSPNLVHSGVVVDGSIGELRHRLMHDSYAGLHDYFTKFNAYTTKGAEELVGRKSPGAATVVLRFPATFLKEYLVRLNIAHGYQGFLWSLFSAMVPVVKYAKLREMRRARSATAGSHTPPVG